MQVKIPFDLPEGHALHEDLYQCGLFRTLPPALQQACQQNVHLLEYLHMLPIEKTGVPQYYPKLNRKLGDLKPRNLFYPVAEDVLIHVWSGSGEERDMYIPIEPSLSVKLNGKMTQVENRLLDMATEFADVETQEEREQALLSALKTVCQVPGSQGQARPGRRGFFSRGDRSIPVTAREFHAIRYLVLRDKAGLGVLHPMVQDSNIEDISCSGLGHIFLEHKIFKGMKSAVVFETHEELDEFVLRLSEHIKRPVTLRNPIVDAVLPDGSRINIVYGKEVSQRGSNFSIRKFNDTPLSVMELIEFGSLNYHMAAYLSLVLEEGMNTFVAGETASGKTTLLNALTTFIPAVAKVVSIEDTPELQVPHSNWIREVSKALRRGEQGGEVSMFDLLKAALRQRPNVIIIGEIRGEEGAIAFQAMQTGHAVMATFHASSVEKLIQRLTGNPINVPKTYIDNLNIVVIQSAVKLPNGKLGRRSVSINEIVGYDPVANTFSFVEVFRWDPSADTFEFVGYKNSYILEEKIARKRGLPPNRKWEIYDKLEKRAKILRKLHKEKGITGYYELLRVIARAQQEGLF
ncbi:MAG: type II/IV secretion system ATPase subunit [Chloroflexi bacterium]|nr:type II/IV secretion system ATPase subunit [Chloroflexota bacterium]